MLKKSLLLLFTILAFTGCDFDLDHLVQDARTGDVAHFSSHLVAGAQAKYSGKDGMERFKQDFAFLFEPRTEIPSTLAFESGPREILYSWVSPDGYEKDYTYRIHVRQTVLSRPDKCNLEPDAGGRVCDADTSKHIALTVVCHFHDIYRDGPHESLVKSASDELCLLEDIGWAKE